tara:strand:- start:500 stop:718 length:219 start_codon:yes stop_codon:yes gene_type:complete
VGLSNILYNHCLAPVVPVFIEPSITITWLVYAPLRIAVRVKYFDKRPFFDKRPLMIHQRHRSGHSLFTSVVD